MRTNRKIIQCMLFGFFHQCAIIMLIVTEVLNVDLSSFKCPVPSQWKFRAASKCNDTEKYICLFDENRQKDEEFCGSWPDFENPGYKQILLGGTTREPCSDDRFQPFTFWTNGSSKCVYKKTHCNIEGQVIHNNGSLKTNRICRCDYTKNYDFVLKPRNGCFCVPSEEDCSCYVKTCPKGHRLTRDYECLKESKLKFNCPEIYKDSIDEQMRTTTIITLDEKEISAGSVAWSAIIVTSVCMSACLVLFLVYHMRINSNNFGVSSKSRNVQEEESVHYILEKKRDLQTGMNGFNKYQTTCLIPYDVLDLQEKKIMKWRERHMLFEETSASKTVLDQMKKNGFVIISGPPGSGKSAIAYNTAFKLEKDKEFKILPVSSPEEIRKYLLPETKQVFLIDDVVGKYTVDETCIQRWKNEETFIKQAFSNNLNTKLILTCRSYIYNSWFSRKLQISPIHCDLLSHDLMLSDKERTHISHRYNISPLQDDTLKMYGCLPLLCAVYSEQKDTSMFFVNPRRVLTEEMINTKENSDIAFIAIAVLVVQNNNMDRQILSLENPTINYLLTDICNECGFKYFPSTTVLSSALHNLVGTYVKETDIGFACIHDRLFQNLSFIVGSHIIHCLLKYGSSTFLANRMQLTSIQEKHEDLVIMVERDQEELYFQRLLMDIKKGYHSHVFTGIQMKYLQFRTKLHTCLKSLKDEDIACDGNNSTPLHTISEQGYDDFVFTLFNIKRDQINLQDNYKRTPLFLACLGGHHKVIQTLLTLDNSSLHVANNEDLTPFDVASVTDDVFSLTILLKCDAKTKINKKDRTTALQRACAKGSYNAVTFLLTKNADIKYKDINGLKAIHIASAKGHLEIAELLLKHDKSIINDCDNNGRTPLFTSCENNQQNVVCMLLENKADVNKTDLKGISPLHVACKLGNENIVGVLLDYSPKVNVQSKNGFSPLHTACLNGNIKIVELLLDKNADINLITKQGSTPFYISCIKGYLEICEVLQLKGANINSCAKSFSSPLHVACRDKHERIVRFLLEHNADIYAVNTKKESSLYIACVKESFDIVELLLRYHADVNMCEEEGNSPLHAACLKGNKKIVQLLLDKKADIHKRNKAGKSPCDVVQHLQGGDGHVIVELLNRYKTKE